MEKVGNQGYPPAEATLGGVYLQGTYGAPKQPTLGLAWFRRAIDQGFVPAECGLAQYYLSSKPADPDLKQAMAWLSDGSDKGEPSCLNNEAWALATWPDATLRDPHKAV